MERRGGEVNTSGFAGELCVQEQDYFQEQEENTKSCTQYWVACAVKGRCCCPQEQSNKSCTLLHSSIPSLLLVSCGSLSNYQHSPESYRGSWLFQNINTNILRPSPNIAKIFCPHVIVLYAFFYLASAKCCGFFCPFLTIVTQILNFSPCWVEQWEFFYHYFKCFSQAWFKKG